MCLHKALWAATVDNVCHKNKVSVIQIADTTHVTTACDPISFTFAAIMEPGIGGLLYFLHFQRQMR